MMNKSSCAALIVIALMAIAAGLATTGVPVQQPELSGTLNLLCTPQILWCEGMKTEFQRSHPKVTVEFVRLSSGEVLPRLRDERANPQFDIWWGGPIDSFIAARQEGLLEAYDSPNLADLIDLKSMKGPDNYWAGIYVGSVGFASNKHFLDSQVRQEIDGALIQEYLAGFGMKMIWRIVPAPMRNLKICKRRVRGGSDA